MARNGSISPIIALVGGLPMTSFHAAVTSSDTRCFATDLRALAALKTLIPSFLHAVVDELCGLTPRYLLAGFVSGRVWLFHFLTSLSSP